MLRHPSSNRKPEVHTSGVDLTHAQVARELTVAQVRRKRATEIPHYARPLPVPPDVDFEGVAQSDFEHLVMVAAVAQLANQNGNSVQAQLDIWNHGRG